MTISFKNVGVRQDEALNNPVDNSASLLPIGIKTPLELSYGNDDIFIMHTDIKEQVRDNLKNLLLTNFGERLAQYNYGANLRPLCSEYSNKDNFDTEAMLNINTAVRRWMPFITPLEFDSTIIKDRTTTDLARIRISVIYSIPKLRVSKDRIDIYMVLM